MNKLITIWLTFLVAHSLCSQNNINYYEYWFDSNYDEKTETSISPVSQFTLNENISTTDLINGLHTFHIRFKDDSARYSSIVSQFFIKPLLGIQMAEIFLHMSIGLTIIMMKKYLKVFLLLLHFN